MALVLEKSERKKMTLQEFEELPEGPPHYDYIRGEAIQVNRPTARHSDIQYYLLGAIKAHVNANGTGRAHQEIDVKLPSGDWVGPDIVFLSREHFDRYDEEKGDLLGIPDLIVEISSPSTASYDRVEKLDLYWENEVPWVWFVEQNTLSVEEFRWTNEGYLRAGSAVAGAMFRPHLFEGLVIDLLSLMSKEPTIDDRDAT